MKKALVLSTVELSRMTLLSIYTDYFKDNNIHYDIICARKVSDNTDEFADQIFEFDASKTMDKGKFKKVLHFLKMRQFLHDVLDHNKYDFIVIWNQITSGLLGDIIVHSRIPYCVNIRDYHYDDFPLYRYYEKAILQRAQFNTISSDAYKTFLPKGDYLTLHSFNKAMLNGLKIGMKRNEDGPIRILNIGQIRWLENIYPIIDEIGNDNRYLFLIIGVGAERLEDYIKERNIRNVVLHGRFDPKETTSYLNKADVIFNLYGVGNLHVDTALSIKLYYAAYLGIPILTYKHTYMNEISTQIGIGYTIEKESISGFADDFFLWYKSFDFESARRKCDDYINDAICSHNRLYRYLENY